MSLKRIVCFGDSITQGTGMPDADRWPGRLAFLLEKKAGDPDRCEVYNRGVGGDTTALALDRIQRDVLPLLPATVLIEFGINDSYVYPGRRTSRVGVFDYEQNLKEIVRLVRDSAGVPVLIVNHPLTRRKDVHRQGNGLAIGKNLEPYNRIVRRVAKQTGTRSIDLPQDLKKRRIGVEASCSEDGVHLSPEGSRFYAEIVFEKLIPCRH